MKSLGNVAGRHARSLRMIPTSTFRKTGLHKRCFSGIAATATGKNGLPFIPLCDRDSLAGAFNEEFMSSAPKPLFNANLHRYTYQGTECKSVTTLLGDLFPKFDADAVVKQYYDKWQREPNSKYFGMSKEEIKGLWSDTSARASAGGTATHAAIERCFIKGDLPSVTFDSEGATSGEAACFESFLESHGEIVAAPVAVEQRLVHPALRLAGTVDFLSQCPSGEPGHVIMLDWKRTQKVLSNGQPRGRFDKSLKAPLAHLWESPFIRYALQLNMYKFILADVYNIKVSSMALVQIPPGGRGGFKLVDVPCMDEEVALVISARQACI